MSHPPAFIHLNEYTMCLFNSSPIAIYHIHNCYLMAKYLRDGRAPIPESEITSKVMSANRGKNTAPELQLRKALRDVGLPGYRLHWKGAPGRPDIAYPRFRVAIFVHGDFWHRCPICNLSLPKTHTDFWEKKLQKNVERDAKKTMELELAGWKVFTFWEHEVKADATRCANEVKIYNGQFLLYTYGQSLGRGSSASIVPRRILLLVMRYILFLN